MYTLSFLYSFHGNRIQMTLSCFCKAGKQTHYSKRYHGNSSEHHINNVKQSWYCHCLSCYFRRFSCHRRNNWSVYESKKYCYYGNHLLYGFVSIVSSEMMFWMSFFLYCLYAFIGNIVYSLVWLSFDPKSQKWV